MCRLTFALALLGCALVPATATAGTFVSDTMTGTAGTLLSSHTGETGATWTKHPSYSSGSAVLTDANRVRNNVANVISLYTASGVPASPDYTVDADINVKSVNGQAGVTARTSATSNDAYGCRYAMTPVAWQLTKLTGGTLTILASRAQTLTAGSTYHLQLKVSGSTISCTAGGSSVGSVTDTTFTAAGRVGVRLDQGTISNTAGLHLDNFVAADILPADITPPDTTITSGPANPTTSTSASFSFTGTDNVGVTGFDCRLEGAAFAACTSPKAYSGLTVGTHTFEARARDAAGNVDATPASYTWTINSAGTLYFSSDWDAHPTDPGFNYRATSGGIEGAGSYSVVDDPDGVIEPGNSTVRKVLKTDVDYTDSGNDTCPRRSRVQFRTGGTIGGFTPTFGSSYYIGLSIRLPSDFPAEFNPADPGQWINLGEPYGPPFAGSSPGNTAKLSIEPGARIGLTGDLRPYWTGPTGNNRLVDRGKWTDLVYWIRHSSGVNVADGEVKVWQNTGNGFVLLTDKTNVVTINSAMSQGTIFHYYPKLYYPSTLTAPAGWSDYCASSGKTYYPADPNGTYGWGGRPLMTWNANVKLGSTFDVVKPRTYE